MDKLQIEHPERKVHSTSRRVLMLAATFPPGDQYILRSVKFSKYLPDFGWEPIVLTAQQPLPKCGIKMEAVLGGTQIVRTRRFTTPSLIAQRLMAYRMKLKTTSRDSDVSVASSYQNYNGDAESQEERGRVESLLRQALLWGDMPDNYAGWLPQALRHGRRLIRTKNIAVIHASGPPFSVVLAGALLSRLTGVPMVADFRDTWAQDQSDPIGTMGGAFRTDRSEYRMKILQSVERWCLSHAQAVLFTSRATQLLYERHYPNLKDRNYLIYNGVDPDDLHSEVEALPQPTIAYIGTLHLFQWPQVRQFLNAFVEARNVGVLPSNTQIVFAGPLAGVQRLLERTISELNLQSATQVLGAIPHRDAVAWIQRSHVLLLFVGDNPFIRLSKISEYVASGRPMLAFAPEHSETANEVRAYGGTVVTDDSASTLVPTLSTLLEGGLNKAPVPSDLIIQHPHPLNRYTNAQQLAQILNSIIL